MRLGRTELGKRLFHSAERMLFAILISSTSTLSNSYLQWIETMESLMGFGCSASVSQSSSSADRSDAGPQMVEAQDLYRSFGFCKNT
jgi:hypothetical protein